MKNSVLFITFIFIVACGTTLKSIHIPLPTGPLSIELQAISPEVKQSKALSTQPTTPNSDANIVSSTPPSAVSYKKEIDSRIDVTEKIGMDWSYLGADVIVSDGVITIKDTVGYDYTGIKSPKIIEPGTYMCVFPASLRNGKKFAGGEAGGGKRTPSLPVVASQAASDLKYWVEHAHQESLTGMPAW